MTQEGSIIKRLEYEGVIPERKEYQIDLHDDDARAFYDALEELDQDWNTAERYGHAPGQIIIDAGNIRMIITSIAPNGYVQGYVVEA